MNFLNYKKLIYKLSFKAKRKFRLGVLELDDLVSVSYLAFIAEEKKYDPKLHPSFMTFIASRVYYRIVDYIRKHEDAYSRADKRQHIDISFKDYTPSYEINNEDSLLDRVDLDRYISLGTEKQQELLELMKLGHAQADAAEILNISQSTANARILSFKKRLTNLNY